MSRLAIRVRARVGVRVGVRGRGRVRGRIRVRVGVRVRVRVRVRMGVPLEDVGAQLEAHELGDLLVHALGLGLLHVLLEAVEQAQLDHRRVHRHVLHILEVGREGEPLRRGRPAGLLLELPRAELLEAETAVAERSGDVDVQEDIVLVKG